VNTLASTKVLILPGCDGYPSLQCYNNTQNSRRMEEDKERAWESRRDESLKWRAREAEVRGESEKTKKKGVRDLVIRRSEIGEAEQKEEKKS